jgi:hypothetical protein
MIETPSTKWNPVAKIASQTSGRTSAEKKRQDTGETAQVMDRPHAASRS